MKPIHRHLLASGLLLATTFSQAQALRRWANAR